MDGMCTARYNISIRQYPVNRLGKFPKFDRYSFDFYVVKKRQWLLFEINFYQFSNTRPKSFLIEQHSYNSR